MALTDARWQVDYVDDFGNEWPGIGLKFGGGVCGPHLIQFYEKETVNCGRGNFPFKPRALVATFPNGKQTRYVLPHTGLLETFVRILYPSLLDDFIPGEDRSCEAVCIDLEGEEWNYIPATFLQPNLVFRTEPYTNIAKRSEKTSIQFDYSSDVPNIGTVKMTRLIEKAPSDLVVCQKAGMANNVEKKAVCQAQGIITRNRRFIIIASWKVDTNGALPGGAVTGSIRRNAHLSTKFGKNESRLQPIADCAECLGYQGESVRNVHRYVSRSVNQ